MICTAFEKMQLETKFDSTIMFVTSKYPMISIFIEIRQSKHFPDGGHFEKKCVLEIKFDSTIMFITSNYPKISIFIEIGQSLQFCNMAAILKENGSPEMKFNSTIMFTTPKTTYPNLNYLSSYYTFWDIKCQSGKIRKNSIKRAITHTSFHGSSRKSHSR